LSVVPARDPRVRSAPQLLTGETPNPVDVPAGCRFHPRCPVAVERCSAQDPALAAAAGSASASHEVACLLA
jgi:oligopeptide/dipeptide ABC transporter ATP-binding protein